MCQVFLSNPVLLIRIKLKITFKSVTHKVELLENDLKRVVETKIVAMHDAGQSDRAFLHGTHSKRSV
jgi:hypothetical protein